MKLFSYLDFLLETENVKLNSNLKEYVLTHTHDGMFKIKSADYYKEFSVIPYKKETLDSLKEAYHKLVQAIKDLSVNTMYSVILSTERIPYTFGNMFPTEFSLKSIPEINTELEDDQERVLKSSEKDFLANEFSRLNKNAKDNIIEVLRERCEMLCVVIDALFYYIRMTDTENFYKGMNRDEICEHYEDIIKKSSTEELFSFSGPFNSDLRNPIDSKSNIAYWICEKNSKKFVIKGTINPIELKSEDNVNGTQSMKLSLSLEDENLKNKDFKYFNIEDLSSRIKMLNKILKKI
jgi:hypothetical protein